MDELNKTTPDTAPVPENDIISAAADAQAETAPDLRQARRAFSRIGWAVFAILAVTTALQAIATSVVSVVFETQDPPSWLMWALTFAPLYCVGVPVGLLILRKLPVEHVEPQRFGAGRFLKLIPICIFLMYAGNLVGLVITNMLGVLKGGEVTNPLNSFAMDDLELVKILIMAVLAPLVEEFVFRKALIDRMRPYGEGLAVTTSALLFGLFHGNLSQFFYAFALGVVFGYVYARTRRLRYSVALHMLVNSIGSIIAPWLLKNAGIEQLTELDMTDALSEVQALQSLLTPGLLMFVIYVVLILLLAILGFVLLLVNAPHMEYAVASHELPRDKRLSTAWCNAGMIVLVLGCLAMIAASVVM